MPTRIAILGAGFSGLATAWHLFRLRNDLEIVIFDPNGIGGKASSIAAGLVHPFAGAHGKLNRYGYEGMTATLQLIDVAEKTLGKPVCERTGLLRLAVTEQQKQDFFASSQKHAGISWLKPEECQKLNPHLSDAPGIFVHSAVTVNSKLYTSALWQACQQHQVTFEKKEIKNLTELNDFDQIILAVGAAWRLFPETSQLPLTSIKGQILELEWNETLSCPLNSHAYLIPQSHQQTCIVGATYERNYATDAPCLETALNEILPKAKAMFPPIEQCKVLECRAGIRVSTKDHLPLIAKVGKNSWIITGMGSKGLLYHALYAQKLAQLVNDIKDGNDKKDVKDIKDQKDRTLKAYWK